MSAQEWIEVEQVPFAQVACEVTYDQRISAQAHRVYVTLLNHGLTPERCFPGHRRIGELLGIDHRTVPRLMTQLYRAGWVRRVARWRDNGARTSNGYYLAVTRSTADRLAAEFETDPEPAALRAGRERKRAVQGGEVPPAQDCAGGDPRRIARTPRAGLRVPPAQDCAANQIKGTTSTEPLSKSSDTDSNASTSGALTGAEEQGRAGTPGLALATQIVDATPVPFTTAAELAPVVAQLIADGWTAAQVTDAATDPRLKGWTLKAFRWAHAQAGAAEPSRSYRDQRAVCDRCAGAGAVFLADGTAAQCECTGAGPVPLVEASDPAPGTATGVAAAREASRAARARRTGDTGTDASEAA